MLPFNHACRDGVAHVAASLQLSATMPVGTNSDRRPAASHGHGAQACGAALNTGIWPRKPSSHGGAKPRSARAACAQPKAVPYNTWLRNMPCCVGWRRPVCAACMDFRKSCACRSRIPASVVPRAQRAGGCCQFLLRCVARAPEFHGITSSVAVSDDCCLPRQPTAPRTHATAPACIRCHRRHQAHDSSC
jgi:hypothetical protein